MWQRPYVYWSILARFTWQLTSVHGSIYWSVSHLSTGLFYISLRVYFASVDWSILHLSTGLFYMSTGQFYICSHDYFTFVCLVNFTSVHRSIFARFMWQITPLYWFILHLYTDVFWHGSCGRKRFHTGQFMSVYWSILSIRWSIWARFVCQVAFSY